MAEELSSQGEIRVVFTTQLKKYAVPAQPIALPASLRRSQLSQTINALLQLSPPVPFDFLVGGSFLRTSLAKYVDAAGLSSEAVLEVEYVLATPPPPPPQHTALPDWVAALAARRDGLVLAGSYDHVARVLRGPAGVTELRGHTGAVKAVAWLGDDAEADAHYGAPACLTGSQDETLRLWSLGPGAAPRCRYLLQGHTAAVAALAVQPSGKMAASGALDAGIKLWSATQSDDSEAAAAAAEAEAAAAAAKSAKKRRVGAAAAAAAADATASAAALPRTPLGSLVGSGGAVRALAWPARGVLFSAGDDHCVRQWDVQTAVNTHTFAGSEVVLALAHSPAAAAGHGLLAAGCMDGKVRCYDARVGGSDNDAAGAPRQVVQAVVAAHAAPIAAVAWSAAQPQWQLATCALDDAADGNVKLWDLRARTVPLHVLAGHAGKVLAAAWVEPTVLHTGGADKTVKHHTMAAA